MRENEGGTRATVPGNYPRAGGAAGLAVVYVAVILVWPRPISSFV